MHSIYCVIPSKSCYTKSRKGGLKEMTIRVAVCEDNEHDMERALALLNQWAQKREVEIEVQAFADTEKLLGQIGENFLSVDVYILDIDMRTSREGLELARLIRKSTDELPIIFISAHIQLTYDSYEVNALHFVGKPISETRFFHASHN